MPQKLNAAAVRREGAHFHLVTDYAIPGVCNRKVSEKEEKSLGCLRDDENTVEINESGTSGPRLSIKVTEI